MKLLYTVITVGLLQLLVLTPLEALTTSTNTTLAQKSLVQLYENSISKIDKVFCEKAKTLSEKLLRDKLLQKRSFKPQIQDFKKNITNFLHIYPFFEHYGSYNKLVNIFAAFAIKYYQKELSKDQDAQSILKLLRQHGYDVISDEYENEFVRFIKLTFISKVEEFKAKLSPEELKQHQGLVKWLKDLKQCQDYNCYYKYFNLVIGVINTRRQELFEFITSQLERINIFYAISANDIVKTVLADQKLEQLNPDLRTNLTRDIKHFIMKFKSNKDLQQLYGLISMFHHNITLKYIHNTKLPDREQQLLMNIFNRHGYMKFQNYNEILFNDFVQRGLPTIFEPYKKSLTAEELLKEKKLLDWYDNLKSLKTYEQRVEAFNRLYPLINN